MMEHEHRNNDNIPGQLTGMSRPSKLFVRVDNEGFLMDSLAISDVVNFDCIESIMTSAKRIVSLFTDVAVDNVCIDALFYYKRRARSTRMNPVRLLTTTDGFRAIAEHPSGEIPLGVDWSKKSSRMMKTMVGEKRPRSASPAQQARTYDVPEKQQKLITNQYKTYMPTLQPAGDGSVATETSVVGSKASSFDGPIQLHNPTPVQEPTAVPPRETKTLEKNLKYKSNYHWSNTATCEVLLHYDGISERRKLKPGLSTIMHALLKGNYNVLRQDLHQDLSMGDARQTQQDLLNEENYTDEDTQKSIKSLHEAKSEIFKVLSLLCMSKARFKDLLDWMRTLRVEEGKQGKYYLSERSLVGGGLRVMYDTDEQAAARLNSLHRARTKNKEATKVLYPVTPLTSSLNKPDRPFVIMLPNTNAPSATTNIPQTSAVTQATAGDSRFGVYATMQAGQSLVPLTVMKNPNQVHPTQSKDLLPSEGKMPSLTQIASKLTDSPLPHKPTKDLPKQSARVPAESPKIPRVPNILRNKSQFHSQKLVPPSGDPVPMQLYRSYPSGSDPENMHIAEYNKDASEDSDSALQFIIKQEPVEGNTDGYMDNPDERDNYSDILKCDAQMPDNDDLNLKVVIKTEPVEPVND